MMDTNSLNHERPFINQLPADVLIELFKSFIRNGVSQLLIVRVCSLWRRLLHSYPLFWTTIRVFGLESRDVARVAHFIRLAADCPFEIVIQPDNTVLDSIQEIRAAQRLATLLSENIHAVRTLSVHASAPVLATFFGSLAGLASALKSLSIVSLLKYRGHHTHEFLPVSIELPFDLPARITLTLAHSDGVRLSPSLSSKVTTILVTPFGTIPYPILDLFRSCANVVDVFVQGMGDIVFELPSPHEILPIRLPHLTSLSFDGLSSDSIVNLHAILDALHIPAVKLLTIAQHTWDEFLLNSLIALVRQCSALDLLELKSSPQRSSHMDGGDHFPRVNAEDPLILPSITKLYVTGGGPFIYRFLGRATLPNLKSLKFASTHLHPRMIIQCISSSPELEKLSIEGVGVPVRYTYPRTHIVIPALTSLGVENSFALLQLIRAPHLKSLGLAGTRGDLAAALLDGFFGPDELKSLTSLKMDSVDLDFWEIVWCLSQLPFLERLYIKECDFADSVLRALAKPYRDVDEADREESCSEDDDLDDDEEDEEGEEDEEDEEKEDDGGDIEAENGEADEEDEADEEAEKEGNNKADVEDEDEECESDLATEPDDYDTDTDDSDSTKPLLPHLREVEFIGISPKPFIKFLQYRNGSTSSPDSIATGWKPQPVRGRVSFSPYSRITPDERYLINVSIFNHMSTGAFLTIVFFRAVIAL